MRQEQALLMTRVVACVVVLGALLSVPVSIRPGDDLEAGLMVATLLLTGLAAGVPVLLSTVVHAWSGRSDTWTPVVAMSAAAVAHVLYMTEGGRPAHLIPTALFLIVVYAALMFIGVWLARRVTGRSDGVSAER